MTGTIAGRPITLPFLAFAGATAVALLAPVATDDLVYNRTRLTIWLTLLLASPAVALLLSGGTRSSKAWRAWWSAAFAMFLLHIVWGYGIAFGGDASAVLEAQGRLVGGSNFGLAAVWGASVAVAWLGLRAPWLHALTSLFFLVSAVTSTLVFGRWPSPLFGGVLLLAVVTAAAAAAIRSSMETKVPPTSPTPEPPALTGLDLVRQFWADIYGKEVQSAATYSYTWLADQMGHVCIGLLLHFGLTAIAYQIAPWSDVWCEFAGFVAAAAIVSFWEFRAFRTSVGKAGGVFPLGRTLLRRNAVVAAAYMILGAGVGWAFHNTVGWAVPAFIGLTMVAVLLAPPWLRQKIVWQKAGMPYLARLADTNAEMDPGLPEALWSIVEGPPPPAGPPRTVLIAGPIGSGRTSMACGIATEFAFKGVSVRYLNFDELFERAAVVDYELAPPLPGPVNIGYWPWGRAQVLVIDNLGPFLVTAGHRGGEGELEARLESWLGTIRAALAARHTVWIMGEAGADTMEELTASATAIGRFLGVEDPLAILLRKPDASPRAMVAHVR